MMKNIVIGLILPLLLAVSCVEKIVLDPMEEMPVVVNCVLTGEADMNAAGLSAGSQYVDLFRAISSPRQDGSIN